MSKRPKEKPEYLQCQDLTNPPTNLSQNIDPEQLTSRSDDARKELPRPHPPPYLSSRVHSSRLRRRRPYDGDKSNTSRKRHTGLHDMYQPSRERLLQQPQRRPIRHGLLRRPPLKRSRLLLELARQPEPPRHGRRQMFPGDVVLRHCHAVVGVYCSYSQRGVDGGN